eukprot:jgi/Ulvmu1/117/UM001_0121.1
MAAVLEKPLNPSGLPQSVLDEQVAAVGSAIEARSAGPGKSPPEFQKGVAISVWQNCGGSNSNWGRFADMPGKCFNLVPNIMDRSSPNDGGTGFWERYKEDIQLAKQLGVNAFRFSFEWHRIEPVPGQIDTAAVARFTEIIDAIEAAGMVPNATLHHFVHPDWWEARGGFEKEANLPAFLEYCRFCAATWGPRVKMWSTFNEPTCALVCGWLIGAHPPGKILQIGLMGHVLCNMMKAHAAAYTQMKEQPDCSDLQIGLVHHHVEFMPSSPWWVWLRPLCWWGTFWWGRDTVLHFLQTGEFTWHVPLWGKTIDYKGAKPGLDWWGINYYARGVISPYLTPVSCPGELMTDMQYTLYPTGLYENIVRGSALRVPMYISEIGAADRSEDDHIRIAHIESFSRQVLKAIRDGYDVRGLYYWTLLDNFEWNAGYLMKFGLYYWDPPEEGKARSHKIKPGGRVLAQVYADMPTDMKELRNRCIANTGEASDYETRVREAQRKWRLWPVIWNKGRFHAVEPLSPLHLRIGLHDVDLPAGTDPKRAPVEVELDSRPPADAPAPAYT